MFTGIITRIGSIAAIKKQGDWVFDIEAGDFARDAMIGASIACSGVCLTVTDRLAEGFRVQVSGETLARTTLSHWREGIQINLERALKVGDELGGHFVSGHVDGLAVLESRERAGDSETFRFRVENASALEGPPLHRLIAPKGSVTLDGVSLTVNRVQGERFSVNIIPHTLAHTTLGERRAGEAVNLEIDLLARYLMRWKEA